MTFHNYQINLVEKKRKNLFNQASSEVSSQDYLNNLKQAKGLLKLENELKSNYDILLTTKKDLESNFQEKQKLSEILKELAELKELADNEKEILEKRQYTLVKLSQELLTEEKLKQAISRVEIKLKDLEEQASSLIDSMSQKEDVIDSNNNILVEKVSQILEQPVTNSIE